MKNLEIHQRFDAETIRNRVHLLGEVLTDELAQSDPLLISLLSGSAIFVADLVRAISRPLRYEFISVQYPEREAEEDHRVLEMQYPIPFSVEEQRIILVRDVTASGVIESYLRSQFLDQGAVEVSFVSLINIEDQRKVDFSPDHTLFSCDRTGTFVGYGMKFEGRYGNLPYIGELERDWK
jgi:hypoxanthine phosphoribosyltransferase